MSSELWASDQYWKESSATRLVRSLQPDRRSRRLFPLRCGPLVLKEHPVQEDSDRPAEIRSGKFTHFLCAGVVENKRYRTAAIGIRVQTGSFEIRSR